MSVCCLFFLIVSIGCGSLLIAGDAGVRLKNDHSEIHPGGLVEVDVWVESETFVHPTLEAPRHSYLQKVMVQELPFRVKEKGGYEYRWRLVYQAMQSGEITLEGGWVELDKGKDGSRFSLKALALAVVGFGDEVDHDGVEMFSGAQAPDESRLHLSWVGVVIVSLLVAAFVFYRVQVKRGIPSDGPNITPFRAAIEGLLAEANEGRFSTSSFERFLRDFRGDYSSSLEEEIEYFLYSENYDPCTLRKRLEEGLGQ